MQTAIQLLLCTQSTTVGGRNDEFGDTDSPIHPTSLRKRHPRRTLRMFLHSVATLMHAVNVRQLKNNPSEALREAKLGPIVVMNRDRPDAVLIGIEQLGIVDLPHVRSALAVSLFKGGDISVAAAARVADMPLAQMLDLLSAMRVPLHGGTPSESLAEMEQGTRWLAPNK